MAQDEKTTKTTSQEEIGKEQTETKTGGELAKPQQMIGNYPVDVRVGKNGAIQAVAFKVKLTKTEGDIYGIPYFDSDAKNWKKRYMVSAQGYQRLNSFAGVHIITPRTLIINGQEHNNPYIERDEDGVKQTVYVRKIGLGRGPGGNLIALDQTLSYSPGDYLKRDIQNIKAKSVVRNIVKNKNFKEKEGFWYLKVFDNLYMEIDLNHEETMKCIKTYQERVNFAERLAATIVERNIMKKHPAIARQTVRPNDKGEVVIPIVSWRESDMEIDKVNEAAVSVSEGRRPTGVEVVQETGKATHEDVDDATVVEDNNTGTDQAGQAVDAEFELVENEGGESDTGSESDGQGEGEPDGDPEGEPDVFSDDYQEPPEPENQKSKSKTKGATASKKDDKKDKENPEQENESGGKDDPEKIKKVVAHILEMKDTFINMLQAPHEWDKIMKEHAPDLQGTDGPDLATLPLNTLKKIQGACQRSL